ncbi:helix-turn-helix domain-containing protein [Zafaria sp. Z1313]|uniref:helix-turn-helix domain-containing protein n=1 Tax=unclassified Zafaria TaxID=2828765 RepID=UPI002E798F41|nr:helix-turn-helix domain-containing protein [Zafaria sp. J156]MEE1620988.1 helix-turn-helix domain-containing protein [Zafaria sp. J156]
MPAETSALTKTTRHPALPASDADRLARALEESGDVTVFVDGTAVRLPDGAVAAVVDVLERLAGHESVSVSTAERWLNTSQAAQLAGVSNTYMRQLTDAGTIPVQYRGTHRRIRPEDVQAWLAAREAARTAAQAEHEASAAETGTPVAAPDTEPSP